jgi:hypothetical protein
MILCITSSTLLKHTDEKHFDVLLTTIISIIPNPQTMDGSTPSEQTQTTTNKQSIALYI